MKTKIGILGFKDSESQRLVSEIIKDFQNYKINNIEKIDHSNLNDDMISLWFGIQVLRLGILAK